MNLAARIAFGVLAAIAFLALAFLALIWTFVWLGDMSRVIRVVPAPGEQQAIVFTQSDPTGGMSMVFLSVGLATEKPFPKEGSPPRDKVKEILAIRWHGDDSIADKVVFKWDNAERLSICTMPGVKIERFDGLAETGLVHVHLCPEILDAR